MSDITMESSSNPSETLYVRNLNEKISINKLKRELDTLFKTYGTILTITAHKNLKMKGQAFITFENIINAENALSGLQSSKVFEKEIKIEFASKNSDSFFEKTLDDAEFEKHLNERKEAKKIREEIIETERKRIAERRNLKRKNDEPIVESFEAKKKVKLDEFEKLPPNKRLLLQNLPKSTTQAKLYAIFEGFKGFVGIRLVEVRNLSFIDFENENYSTIALQELKNTIKVDDVDVKLTFAKKT